MALTVQQLLELLTASGLSTVPEARALLAKTPGLADGQAGADVLVRRGVLTAFQAEVVLGGNQQSLVLDDYVILDRLGQGGMGAVYRAEHIRMKRPVALKVMSAAALQSPDAVRRFQREAQAAAQLNHPNIVTAFDAREFQGIHFLVLELVVGETLQQLVKRQGPLPVRLALECMRAAALGLDFAHKKGIIHRDIKPANLIVALDQEAANPATAPASGLTPQDVKPANVKVLDMGLARVDSVGALASDMTATGAIMGTLDYMAPEQAEDTRQADARSDIYSLGCTLFFVLTGRVPYAGDTATRKILAHREQPIPPLRAFGLEAPAALEALLQKMLAKDPKGRPPSMMHVVKRLDAILAGEVTSAPGAEVKAEQDGDVTVIHAPEAPPSSTIVCHHAGEDTAPDQTRRHVLVLVGAGLAALVLLAVGWMLVSPRLFLERPEKQGEQAQTDKDSSAKSSSKDSSGRDKDGKPPPEDKQALINPPKDKDKSPDKKKDGGAPPKDGKDKIVSVDKQRDLALWLFDQGGHITLRLDKTQTAIGVFAAVGLPKEPFHITGIVHLRDEALPDAERLQGLAECRSLVVGKASPTLLKILPTLPILQDLEVGAADDEQVHLISALPSLMYLTLAGDKVTAAGLQHLSGTPELRRLSLTLRTPVKPIMAAVSQLKGLNDLRLIDLEVTDDDLAPLTAMKNLNALLLQRTKVTGAGLAQLHTLPIDTLNLFDCPLNDKALTNLADWKSLTSLGLERTTLGDPGLKAVPLMPRLERLFLLSNQKLSEAAAAEVLKARPKLYVNFNGAELKAGK